MSVEEAGIKEKNKGDEQDNAYRSKCPAAVALGLFFRRFLFSESLFVGACFAGCLTLFLFIGSENFASNTVRRFFYYNSNACEFQANLQEFTVNL